jgi:hypothetical protein
MWGRREMHIYIYIYIFVEKPKGKGLPGRSGHRWVKEKEDGVVWAELTQFRIGTIGGLL